MIWISPILPFTTEESWHSWKNKPTSESSIHLVNLDSSDKHFAKFQSNTYINEVVFKVAKEVQKAIEVAKEKEVISQPLESWITCYVNEEERNALVESQAYLNGIFNVSGVDVNLLDDYRDEIHPFSSKQENMVVSVSKSHFEKCPRCWLFVKENESNEICNRCIKAI